MGQCEGTGILQ